MKSAHTLRKMAAQYLSAAGLLIGLATEPMQAQPQSTAAATFKGQVTDEQVAAIVGANVTIRKTDDAADVQDNQSSSTTDGEGRFAFSSLEPGVYTVTITADNFAKYENRSVKLTSA